MKPLVIVAALLVGVTASVYADQPNHGDGREFAELFLLTNSSDFEFRIAMQSLRRGSLQDRAKMDMLAEILWQSCAGQRQIENPDSMAWAIKLIGETGNARYSNVIDFCTGKITHPGPVKYLESSRALLANGTPGSSFVAGQTRLSEIRSATLRNRRPIPPPDELRRRFDGIKTGQTIDEVYLVLGAPEFVTGVSLPRGKAGFLFVRVKLSTDQIQFRYPGVGIARFGFDEGSGRWLLSAGISEIPGRYWIDSRGRFGSILDVAEFGEAADLRLLKKNLAGRNPPTDQELLDRIVDRIYFSQLDSGNELVQALAHLCRLVGDSGNGKYKAVMLKIAESADHRTLRRHAKQAAERLVAAPGNDYLPKGVTDLNAPPPRPANTNVLPPPPTNQSTKVRPHIPF